MTHSSTINWFGIGVILADEGLTTEEILAQKPKYLKHNKEIEFMAIYDGYIRRKHGLVNENGEEV